MSHLGATGGIERAVHVGIMRAALLLYLAALASAPRAAFADNGDPFYQVNLGRPSTTGAEALATIDARAKTVVRWNACGRELEFMSEFINDAVDGDGNAVDNSTGEGIIGKLIAKVIFVHDALRDNNAPCVVQRWTRMDELNVTQPLRDAWAAGDGTNPSKTKVWVTNRLNDLNRRFRKEFERIAPDRDASNACAYDPFTLADTQDGPSDVYLLRMEGRPECFRLQANAAVMRMHTIGIVGTDKGPCDLFGTTHGDWDASLKDVVRLYYIDRAAFATRSFQLGGVLDDFARDHIVRDLFTVDGRTQPESYSFWECGDQQHSTGLPQDRADERDWYDDDPVVNAIGDLLKWLWHRKWLFLGLAGMAALGALGAAATGSSAPLVAALVANGVAGVYLGLGRVPETENHLLMINTSRYLINQVIIDGLPDYDDRHPWEEDQQQVREWLLERFQEIAENDFNEYNARPYQRYSMLAILNIYDFAKSTEIRTAAHGILEFASAKFAVGSAQGRRLVPFRRLLEVIEDDQFAGPAHDTPRSMFEGVEATDYQLIQALLFAGPSIDMPAAYPPPNAGSLPQFVIRAASVPAAGNMIYAASSSYRPEEITLDLAVNKRSYQQYFHHDGMESYSSSPSFFVSAGGMLAGPSDRLIFPPGIGAPGPMYRCVDLGGAVPTILIPRAGAPRVVGTDFLRIENGYYEYSREDVVCTGSTFHATQPAGERGLEKKARKNTWSHDHNTCVYSGFACGTNIVVPKDMEDCLVTSGSLPATWKFFNSATCTGYQSEEATASFYMVIYREPCDGDEDECDTNWGFFYAAEASGYAGFDDFKAKIETLNQPRLPYDGPARSGHFASGLIDVEFDADANQDDSDEWGLVSISGVAQPDIDAWPLASGGVIDADDGLIEIKKPGGGGVRIDLRTWYDPKYEVF